MGQTLNTATSATGLNLGFNIGGDGSTGPVRVEAGAGGVFVQANSGGHATFKTSNAAAQTRIDAATGGTVLIGDSITTGSVTIGQNVTTGSIGLGSSLTTGSVSIGWGTGVNGSIDIGGGSAEGAITMDTLGDITIGSDSGEGLINIGTGATNTGQVYIGNGAASMGINIDSGPSDAVDIGFTGATNIGNNGSGTADITIGHASKSGNIVLSTTGNLNLTASAVRTLGTDQATTLTNGSAEYKGGVGITKNLVLGQNLILGEDIRADVLTRDLLLFNGNTTGSIAMGGGMTTADISLGRAAQTGQIKILPTADVNGLDGVGSVAFDGGVYIAKQLMVGTGIRLGPKTTVTQGTSNTTTVTLNAKFGTISTFGGNIGAHTNVDFQVNNTSFSTGGTVLLFITNYSGAGAPIVSKSGSGTGNFDVRISNGSNSAIDAALQIFFMIV